MGEIKSALELALERTAGIKGDKSSIKHKECEDQGKRTASRLISGEISDSEFSKALKDVDKKERSWFTEGCYSVFSSYLKLPSDEGFAEVLEKVKSGLSAIARDSQHIDVLFGQISQFFSQYLSTKKQLEEQLTAQYEPQLKKKEAELSRQTGTEIRLNPMQDPEFVQILKRQTGELDRQYNEALRQAKDQIRQMLS